jgi:hypothetical protein
MKRLAHGSCLLVLLLIALPALSDDQEKAQKLLGKVAAMAADPNGRQAVNLAVSETISVRRPQLAQLRHLMNLTYGDLFLAYYLARNGINLDEIGAQMKSGKTVWQIASEKGTDFKQLAIDAKKLNGKIDENLLRHFGNEKADVQRNLADRYDPMRDSATADNSVSPELISDARNRYAFLRDHAVVTSGSSLAGVKERAVQGSRPDPIDGSPK